MRARVPGSAANLGPGFDTLALALSIHIEVEIEPAAKLVVKTEGEGSSLPTDESHLAVRVAKEVIGHDRFSVRVNSSIPVARGLGSSAALAVAAAAAAGVDDPLAIASKVDGHPENAAASVLGGLVTATMVDDRPVATSLFLDPDLIFVVVVPDRALETKVARNVLPDVLTLGDAVFNLGRLGWLIAALGDADYLVPEATADRLHQTQRTPLFPESEILLKSLVESGAAAACWSGAGPALLGFCVGAERSEKVRRSAEEAMLANGIEGKALVLEADTGGLLIE